MALITIQGNRGSGKDQVAQYLLFLLSAPRFLHHFWLAKLLKFKWISSKWVITRYAKKLKQIVSILLNVPEERLEDRDFKENYCFDFAEYKVVKKEYVPKGMLLSDKTFSSEIKKGNLYVAREYCLTIRQLLQFIGTEVMRNLFGDTLWINSTLSTQKTNLIIADQRFIIENEISSNYGFCIHILRDGCTPSLHSSETELSLLKEQKAYDVLIENTGTLKDLFNKCRHIIYEHKDKILP